VKSNRDIDPNQIAMLYGTDVEVINQPIDEWKASGEYERIVEDERQGVIRAAVLAALRDAVKKSGPDAIDPDRIAAQIGIDADVVAQQLAKLRASGEYERIVEEERQAVKRATLAALRDVKEVFARVSSAA